MLIIDIIPDRHGKFYMEYEGERFGHKTPSPITKASRHFIRLGYSPDTLITTRLGERLKPLLPLSHWAWRVYSEEDKRGIQLRVHPGFKEYAPE